MLHQGDSDIRMGHQVNQSQKRDRNTNGKRRTLHRYKNWQTNEALSLFRFWNVALEKKLGCSIHPKVDKRMVREEDGCQVEKK